MPTLTPLRILRATVLAVLAALVMATHTFVDVERVRVKVLQTPTPSTAGLVRVNTAAFSQVKELRPPFALIARIKSASAETSPFSVAVDGVPVCERAVAGSSARRVDCAVAGPWSQTTEHAVVVQGPSTPWTLEYLELAMHHGNTDGAHYLVVLPASSDHYVRPGLGWVIFTGLLVFAGILLLPASPPLSRPLRMLYGVIVGAVVLELVVSQASQWISDYRIVLSAGTLARLLVLLFLPRLWVLGRGLVQSTFLYLQREPAARRMAGQALLFVLLAAVAVTAWELFFMARWEQLQIRRRAELARTGLFAELQPVKLANCDFQRFGEANDGGYLLCGNLLGSVQSAYSYGISGYDQWGCDITHKLSVPVHEYDCFNLNQPSCPGGRTVFHGECVGGEAATIDGRPFDTPEDQFTKNGDGTNQLVVKMDVEGAEWDTLLRTPDAVLQRIDQLTIEMHGVQEPERFAAVVGKLKRFFYVANLHYNNFSCLEGVAPFPAEVYEVLFVSKRIGVLGGSGPAGAPRNLAAPNNPQWKDCQSLADLPPVRSPVR